MRQAAACGAGWLAVQIALPSKQESPVTALEARYGQHVVLLLKQFRRAGVSEQDQTW